MSDGEDRLSNSVSEIRIETNALPLGEDKVVPYEPELASIYSQSSGAYSYSTIPVISTPSIVDHDFKLNVKPDIGTRIVCYDLLSCSGSTIKTVSDSELTQLSSSLHRPKTFKLIINCSFGFERNLLKELFKSLYCKFMDCGSHLTLKIYTDDHENISVSLFPTKVMSMIDDLNRAKASKK